jgi:DNA repair protein RadC
VSTRHVSAATADQLAVHDRPREKLARNGAGALGDNELLAIVLGHGTRNMSVLALANQLLGEVGGLHGLARSPRDFLRRWSGVGPVQAARILAAIELGRRSLLQQVERLQFTTPEDAAAYLGPMYGGRGVEHFGVVLLDTRHRELRTILLTIGVLDGAPTHPREVFREAVAGGAAAVILFHNHPSGDPAPSSDDVELTMRMVAAGALMGISVLDHLILANNHYFSFRQTRPRVLGENG